MSRLRVLSPLARTPLFPVSCLLYLPSDAPPNSKARHVIDEFVREGLSTSEILCRSGASDLIVVQALRLVLRLPWLAFWIVSASSLVGRLDRYQLHALVGYALFQRVVKRWESVTPVILSDVSPTFHMLWAACESLNRPVIWWQDDYHHDDYMPFRATDAVVLNQPGGKLAIRKNPNITLYRRRHTPLRPMRYQHRVAKLGIVVNADFSASAEQMKQLVALRNAFDTDELILRLHPTADHRMFGCLPEWLVVAREDQSMEEFAQTVEIAIVGNSAAQIWLIAKGTPVIHSAGLDSLGFDSYGYVEKGLVFGISSPHQFDWEQLKQFYQSDEPGRLLERLVSLPVLPQVRPLKRLVTELRNPSGSFGICER